MAQQLTPNLQLPYYQGADSADGATQQQALAQKLDTAVPAAIAGTVPPGCMMMWPGPVAPNGWLLCQGQTNITAAANPGLAALFGQTGGMVNMPDMRDRFPVGAGAAALNAPGGSSSFVMTMAQMPLHSHRQDLAGGTGGVTGTVSRNASHAHTESGMNTGPTAQGGLDHYIPNAFNLYQGQQGYGAVDNMAPADHVHTINPTDTNHEHGIAPNGGNASIDNRPAFRALNFIVKAG